MKIALMILILILIPAITHPGDGPSSFKESNHLLPACPSTPNCVSSLADDPARRVEPFPIIGSPPYSIELLRTIILSMPRTTVVSTSENKIHAEFRSILGFVDDVLFMVSGEESVVHVRSAARSGYWDLGVNRRRVERIRNRYLSQPR